MKNKFLLTVLFLFIVVAGYVTLQLINDSYTPEQVIALGNELDGKTIRIKGTFELIPFTDSFGLGGASPGFATDAGNITMTNYSDWHGITNGDRIIVRGVYDSESQYIDMSKLCPEGQVSFNECVVRN